jgi:hypothetical protein
MNPECDRPGHRLAELVDLGRYPLFDLGGTVGTDLVGGSRDQIAKTGYAELPGFASSTGVAALSEDAESLKHRAHVSSGVGTAYLELPDLDLDQAHPRRWRGRFSVGAVSYDLIPYSSPLRQLYESDPLTDLISAVLGRGPLYRYADPFGALNLAVMGDGDELQWHFDQTDFVVSLAIQTAETGGNFEVAPLLRSVEDERYADVAAVLSGSPGASDLTRTIPMTPGTLLIFEGRNSMHRVSPISGARLRHVGLLAFDTKPGTTGSELLRMNRYGRTEPLKEPPEKWPVS